MRFVLVLTIVLSSITAFAGAHKCTRIAARSAQKAFNEFLSDKKTVFKSLRLDTQTSPYIADNEAGYTRISFEGRLRYNESQYDSRLNDMMAVVHVNERCQVKSVEVMEISAE